MLNGTQVGPYEIKDVQGWIQAGYVKMEDSAWYEGCGDWVKVKDIPGIEDKKVGHNLSGHLLPPFEAYVGKKPYIFISKIVMMMCKPYVFLGKTLRSKDPLLKEGRTLAKKLTVAKVA